MQIVIWGMQAVHTREGLLKGHPRLKGCECVIWRRVRVILVELEEEGGKKAVNKEAGRDM